MRVLFIPDGGFYKTGGFIEVDDGAEPTGNEPVYQRDSHIHLRINCHNVALQNTFDVRNEPLQEGSDNQSDLKRTSSRSITSIGEVEGNGWRQHKLSMLGSENEQTSVSVNIHESKSGERIFAAGISGNFQRSDTGETFFVEAAVASDRMDELMREIQMPGAELIVSVDMSSFPSFYATWAPEPDEGRVLKFLDSTRDVENAAEIPEDFWNKEIHKKAMSNPDRKPIQISIGRQIGEWLPSEADDDDLDRPVDINAVPAEAARIVSDPAGAQAITAAAAKVSRRIMFLAAAVLIGAVIIAM